MEDLSAVNSLIDSGKRQEAWNLLNQILTANPAHKEAWLLAYSLVDETKKELLLQRARRHIPDLDLSSAPEQPDILNDFVPEKKSPTVSRFLVYLSAVAMALGTLFEWEASMFRAETGIHRKIGYSLGIDSSFGVLVLLLGIGILIAFSILRQKTAYPLIGIMGLLAWIILQYWRNSISLDANIPYGESVSEAFRISLAKESGRPYSYSYYSYGFGYILSLWASFASFVLGFILNGGILKNLLLLAFALLMIPFVRGCFGI